MKWISVEDGLPDTERQVLCHHIDSGNNFVCYYTKDCLTNEPKWYGGAKPSHWCEIIAPVKQVTK